LDFGLIKVGEKIMNQMKIIQEKINQADAILITAGAGMGVDSGLPDFRGTEGFWKEYPVVKEKGLEFEDMANPRWFNKDPHLAWAFYGHRLNLYRQTIPHDGFKILLDLVKNKNDNYFIFTSNVDGQFQKAGFDENKIIECHGSIHYLQCTNGCEDIWKNEENIEIDMEEFKSKSLINCPICGSIARPNILMFGDYTFDGSAVYQQELNYELWLHQNKDKKIVVIEIGAGSAIPTVRMQSESILKKIKDSTLIRINPREAQIDNKYLKKEDNTFSIEDGGLDGIKSICSIGEDF
jgi:NAD-dependent SIR2 family protein deacetylase